MAKDECRMNKPLLPSYLELEPYIRRIDEARYYSNFGGLVTEYEGRLSKLFGAPCVTASSGTSALVATIMALDLPKGSLIACPSWSFVATAAAIVAAGHVPYFVDVNSVGVIDFHLMPVCRAIVVVAPFGALNPEQLEYASEKSNIPIIVDAAAGFDSFSTLCETNKVPVVISTHCTKPFGTGEGGFVTCTDEDLLKKIRHITNFGIESKTSTPLPGINGKMSEYHAAVGLASLDGWDEKRERWLQVKRWYNDALGTHYGDQRKWASSSLGVRFRDIPASELVDKVPGSTLTRYGIHNLEAYKNYPRTELSVTEMLIQNTLMLPIWVDMTKDDVEKTAEALRCASR